MIKLGVIVPVWKRPEIAHAVLRELLRIRESDGLEILPIVIRSMGDDFDRLPAVWWNVRFDFAPNEPLSGKYALGLQQALALGCDCAMLWGSDDFAPWSTFYSLAMTAMLNGHAGSAHLYIHDLASDRTVLWRGYGGARKWGPREPCGPGRTLRRDVLEAMDCNPWRRFDRGVNRGLDGPAHQEALRVGYQCALVAAPVLDVKSNVSITPFEATAGCESVSRITLDLHMQRDFCSDVLDPLRREAT